MTRRDRPHFYQTEAIVLRGVRSGEADRILTLFTPTQGKLSAVARGVMRSRSKLAGHVEPLTRSVLFLTQGKGSLDIISQAQGQESFAAIKNDLERTTRAIYLAELVNGLAAEGVENHPLYTLLLEALRWLESGANIEVDLRHFEVQALGHVGYRPELRRCVLCRRDLEPQVNFFGNDAGGVLCPGCHSKEPSSRSLSLNALKVLRHLQDADAPTARRLRLAPELSAEVEGLLRGYVTYRLEHEVKAGRFLDRLRREGPLLL